MESSAHAEAAPNNRTVPHGDTVTGDVEPSLHRAVKTPHPHRSSLRPVRRTQPRRATKFVWTMTVLLVNVSKALTSTRNRRKLPVINSMNLTQRKRSSWRCCSSWSSSHFPHGRSAENCHFPKQRWITTLKRCGKQPRTRQHSKHLRGFTRKNGN